MSSLRGRALRTLALTAATAALVIVTVGGPATADPVPATPSSSPTSTSSISWSVQPSTGNGPDKRSNFTYTNLKPGTVVTDYVGITNHSNQPVTFHVYASDAFTTQAGALDLLPAAQRPVDVGSWVRFSHATVTVPARARINEPFTLTIPANATPGDHVGGIVAGLTQSAPDGKGGQVLVERRTGAPLYLRVSGPLQAALTVESLSTGYHATLNPFGGGGTDVSYTVHNSGNVQLGSSQTITVKGPFGVTLATVRPKTIGQLLPGGSARITAHLSGVFPAGPLSVQVKLTPTAVAGGARLASPAAIVSRRVSAWATPWPQLILLLLLIAGGYGTWQLIRLRRRRNRLALATALDAARAETAARLTAVGPSTDRHGPSSVGGAEDTGARHSAPEPE